MTVAVLLYRGINVGGRNRIAMNDLQRCLVGAGFRRPETLIQSGNVVCETRLRSPARIRAAAAEAVRGQLGFLPHVCVLTCRALAEIVRRCPFQEPECEPSRVHYLMTDTELLTESAVRSLQELRTESETCCVDGNIIYLHAPDGIARSRIAARAERQLGIAVTARNSVTMSKLQCLCRDR